MFRKNFHKPLIFCVLIVGSCLIAFTSHARELKLLAFGDSLIAGYGLPKKDGFSDQLEAAFNEAGTRLKVINAGVSGDISGLRLTSIGSAQTATIYYGQSFLSKITDYIKEVTSSVGILATSATQAGTSISEYAEDQSDLEEKIAKMTERYMSQFSAMESAVTGFKKTGEFLTGFIDSLNPKD